LIKQMVNSPPQLAISAATAKVRLVSGAALAPRRRQAPERVDSGHEAAAIGWRGTVEAQLSEVQLIHERVDHAHRVVLADVVVHAFGQQEALASIPALDVARYNIPLFD